MSSFNISKSRGSFYSNCVPFWVERIIWLIALFFALPMAAAQDVKEGEENMTAATARSDSKAFVNASDPAPKSAAASWMESRSISQELREKIKDVMSRDAHASNWVGSCEGVLFAVRVETVPFNDLSNGGKTVGPMLLRKNHVLAVRDILTTKAAIRHFEDEGLIDRESLHQSLEQAIYDMQVDGEAMLLQSGAAIIDNLAIAYVLAEEDQILATLSDGITRISIRNRYAETLKLKAKALMDKSNWEQALLLWKQLHALKMATPELYFNAVKCFVASNQVSDAERLLGESYAVFSRKSDSACLESLGDVAMACPTELSQRIAVLSYSLASERFR